MSDVSANPSDIPKARIFKKKRSREGVAVRPSTDLPEPPPKPFVMPKRGAVPATDYNVGWREVIDGIRIVAVAAARSVIQVNAPGLDGLSIGSLPLPEPTGMEEFTSVSDEFNARFLHRYVVRSRVQELTTSRLLAHALLKFFARSGAQFEHLSVVQGSLMIALPRVPASERSDQLREARALAPELAQLAREMREALA